MLTSAAIRELLQYEPDTGRLVWRVTRGSALAGDEAGRVMRATGYRQVRVGKALVYAHRLAWAIHHGEWPALALDHINGERDDNRIANLRLASRAENAWNRGAQVNSSHGQKGVTWNGAMKKWCARIMAHGTRRHLGYFDDLNDAARAYEVAARELHGDFAFVGA